MSDKLLCAAIDFGTTFSTWAFSFKSTFRQEPTRVSAKTWIHSGKVSQKAPTCVLIMPDGKTIDSFGYEAERKYASLSKEHTDWFFFQRFKMQLYSKKIDRHFKLKDISGKELSAKTVFALAIKFLKDDLFSVANKAFLQAENTCEVKDKEEQDGEKIVTESLHANKTFTFEENDIRWVITVPAIWDDGAKQFMREAAIEAGIPKDSIYIGLEPEAASIYCRFLPAVDYKGSMSGLKPGSKYMILDAGGGTVDITVHEVDDEGHLREKHKASGGNWGGTRVDQAYYTLLENIFGEKVLEKMKHSEIEGFQEMLYEFELKKRLTKLDIGNKVRIRVPFALIELLHDELGLTLQQSIQQSMYKEKIRVTQDKMNIDFEIFRGLFDISVNQTTKHVSEILKHPDVSDCKTILMVGGFSESTILQDGISKAFPDINLVIPSDAELSIIKGAVMFGHDPSVVAERKLKFTYGTSIVHEKGGSDCNHGPGKTEELMGVLNCMDIFDVHVRTGQVVRLGEEQVERLYMSLHPLANSTNVEIFSSTDENPTFVTDDSCEHIGTLKVSVTPDLLGAMMGMRIAGGFSVSFMFGGTEIKVKAKDRVSGKEVDVTLDCLGGI